jgi:hypothetical protein
MTHPRAVLLFHAVQHISIDTLLPSSDLGLVAVSNHYERLRSLRYVGCPPPLIVERVLDKRLTMKLAKARPGCKLFNFPVFYFLVLPNQTMRAKPPCMEGI